MDNLLLDDELTQKENNTPIEYAGFWVRVAASFIDTLIFIPFIALNFYNQTTWKILALAFFSNMLITIYKPFMEWKHGATFGKMATKIKVINYNRENISLEQSLIRYTFYALSHLLGMVTTFMLFQNPDFQNADNFTAIIMLDSKIDINHVDTAASVLFFISVIIVAFDKLKQGLHDKLAKTYVVYK